MPGSQAGNAVELRWDAVWKESWIGGLDRFDILDFRH